MGSTGNKKSGGGGLVNTPVGSANVINELMQLKYTDFKDGSGADKWFANETLSNFKEWYNDLTPSERESIDWYTGSLYGPLNDNLYNTPWDEMDENIKDHAANIYNALSKFELKHAIGLTRQCDFQIFGANYGEQMSVQQVKDFLGQRNGVVQNDGFLSAGADNHGTSVDGAGLVIHFKIPPSKGAVGFIKPLGISHENETLINNNAVLQADMSSIHKEGSKIHVDMYWLGQAQTQTIDPKNKSSKKKKKG